MTSYVQYLKKLERTKALQTVCSLSFIFFSPSMPFLPVPTSSLSLALTHPL